MLNKLLHPYRKISELEEELAQTKYLLEMEESRPVNMFEEVFDIKNVLEMVERIPNTKDNAREANDMLESPFFQALIDQLIKQRLQASIENSGDNTQFSLIMASLLGVKALRDELKKYASYLEEEEEEEDSLEKYNVT